MKWIASLMIVAWGLACTEAMAWRGKYKDGPFGSYNFSGDVQDEGYGYGWGLVRTFGEHASLEATFSYHEDENKELTGLSPGLPDVPVNLDFLGFGLTGRAGYRTSENTYLYAGAGISFFHINSDAQTVARARAGLGQPRLGFYEADVENEWGPHIVLGLEVALTPRWETFLEFRHTFLTPEVDIGFAPDIDTPTQTTRSEFDYNFSMIRLGLNYRF